MPKRLENPLEHYIPVPECGCWLWLGGERNGYGVVSNLPGRSVGAHRLFYTSFVGPIPPGMDLCHKCDTPICVNPDHLFPGTRKQNMQDALLKGRMSVNGPSGQRSTLTENHIAQIRQLKGFVYQRIVADAYGVNLSTIYKIQAGKGWRSTS